MRWPGTVAQAQQADCSSTFGIVVYPPVESGIGAGSTDPTPKLSQFTTRTVSEPLTLLPSAVSAVSTAWVSEAVSCRPWVLT